LSIFGNYLIYHPVRASGQINGNILSIDTFKLLKNCMTWKMIPWKPKIWHRSKVIKRYSKN
jgi:hypothetical protein